MNRNGAKTKSRGEKLADAAKTIIQESQEKNNDESVCDM